LKRAPLLRIGRPLSATLVAAALLCLAFFWAAQVFASTLRVAVGEEMVAALNDQGELHLEARALQGEGLWAFSRRLTGDVKAASAIAQANGSPPRLEVGVRYKVPYASLTDDYKIRVVRGLFPEDSPRFDGWHHVHPADAPTLTLWRLAEIFTGKGENFSILRKHNNLLGEGALEDAVGPGGTLFVPAELLLPAYQGLLPPDPSIPSRPTPLPLDLDLKPGANELAYLDDQAGRYAIYRLKRGEALYSAVVVRFTGRAFAEDVNALAAEIAAKNGIPDVTDMAIGQPIRIPVELLLPEYRPADDPVRKEYEATLVEVAQVPNPAKATLLEGVTVILDAGHGGDDPGVDFQGVWESTYVYDVMVRTKILLEQHTAANVIATTRDGKEHHSREVDVLPRSRNHLVLTSPAYKIGDPKVAANLRWYLANSRLRELVKKGVDPAKVVFVSLHADSLHHSLRGAMAYVPATVLTRGEFGKSGEVYHSRSEVRERPSVSFSHQERVRSEGLSRKLAEQILRAVGKQGLAVHAERPIRDRIVRCARCHPFVPAVVRYNAVPAKLLLEICNMNNAEDRRLLTTRGFRQSLAQSLVDGLLGYYGQSPLSEGVRAGGKK
jgi:N-acetylmuramoyl-L-alanine amidase